MPASRSRAHRRELLVTAPDGDCTRDSLLLEVEDYALPGASADTSLKTSQQGAEPLTTRRPYEQGWGWWGIRYTPGLRRPYRLTAESPHQNLRPLVYQPVTGQPGEYRGAAGAWHFYFRKSRAPARARSSRSKDKSSCP
jgi:hypothetical protein